MRKLRKNSSTVDCYFLKPGEELDKVRKTIIINGALNSKIPGKSAYEIAQMAGVDVPKNTKILIGEVESVDISEEFAHEKLSPVLAMYKAKTFDEALAESRSACSRRWIWTYIFTLRTSGRDREDCKTCSSNEDLPCTDQHTFFSRWYRRSLQLQAGSVSYTWLRFMGRKLCIRERRSKTSAEHQDSCREERKYAVVQNT